jgi:hypothetical protein
MLNAIILSVIILSVVMLNVIMLGVIAPVCNVRALNNEFALTLSQTLNQETLTEEEG